MTRWKRVAWVTSRLSLRPMFTCYHCLSEALGSEDVSLDLVGVPTGMVEDLITSVEIPAGAMPIGWTASLSADGRGHAVYLCPECAKE